MKNKYNIWNKWDPLKVVMLGDTYGVEFFRNIKNERIRSALCRITDESKEELAYFESVLKDFGCTVLRPKLDSNESIMDRIDEDKKITAPVPRSPLQPRDCQLVMGNDLVYIDGGDHPGGDHLAIKECLDKYSSNFLHAHVVLGKLAKPIREHYYNMFAGADWPPMEEIFKQGATFSYLSNFIQQELIEFKGFCSFSPGNAPPGSFNLVMTDAPGITVVGKDVYIEGSMKKTTNLLDLACSQKFRFNEVTIGGHSDGGFHTLKPGAILSLNNIQTYKNTFPGWDVCYLPDQSWTKVEKFMTLKKKNKGKWWVPGEEDNDEFTYFVETWLQDWVGYVEETVFDVNVLVLDEHHVCVSNAKNEQVNAFLKKHKMEPVHIPWKHRYFWDGGLHCITLDLYRDGSQQDYFPERKQHVVSAPALRRTLVNKGF